MSKLPIKLKPGDIVKVKLSGDVYEVEVVKVNPKTFLAKMFQTKTRYRKVRKDQTGQMNLFDAIVNDVKRYVKVPYTVRTEKLVKLPKGKLVSVREIRVNKPKNRDARFHHVIDLLNASDSDFTAKEIDEEKFSESSSVLLMKGIKTIEEYLNLSPLIIDTNCEVLDTKEKFGIKKDIFMYTKFRNDQLFYLGTEVTEKCDLRALSNYDLLVNELKELLSAISPAGASVKA